MGRPTTRHRAEAQPSKPVRPRGPGSKLAAKGASLPSGLVGEIVERGDGVPLFLEGVTKTAVDARPVRRAGSPTSRPSLSAPPTLHASLIAMLDRIGPAAKEIAQIGATIGREFS
jgi:predicted ATPase